MKGNGRRSEPGGVCNHTLEMLPLDSFIIIGSIVHVVVPLKPRTM